MVTASIGYELIKYVGGGCFLKKECRVTAITYDESGVTGVVLDVLFDASVPF